MHKKLSLDLLFCNHFLDMIIKAYNKSNSSGVDFITIQHVSASRVKRRLTEHEKVFENHMPNKRLLPNIYKDAPELSPYLLASLQGGTFPS